MSKFVALASHPSLPGGRAEGNLEVEPTRLTLSVDMKQISFPLSGLHISRGGANNSLIFFTHDAFPEWSCYTRDKNILKSLRNTPASDLVSTVSSGERRSRMEWALFLLVVALIIFGVWKAKDPLVGAATYFVPQSWESKAGEVIYSSIRTTVDVIDDDELTAKFKVIVQPLLDVVKDSGYEFTLHLADENELNAFALPGGHIVVHSAVILKAKRAEEVLGVLAHEIAHVTHRHTVKQLFSVLGLYFVFDVVFGNIAGTLAALTQAAPYLLQQGFSRAYEDEADRDGFQYLVKANIDPSGMVDFFKRIAEEENANPTIATIEKQLNFLSTHPGTDERIASLENKVKSLGVKTYRDMSVEFSKFQEDLRTKLKQ